MMSRNTVCMIRECFYCFFPAANRYVYTDANQIEPDVLLHGELSLDSEVQYVYYTALRAVS